MSRQSLKNFTLMVTIGVGGLAMGPAGLSPSPAWAQPADAEEREGEAQAAEREEEGETLADRIQAVERKVFLKRRRFEIHPFVGLDINDAFFQHFFVGAAVAYHTADSFAVELRGGAAVGEIEKGSVRQVRVGLDSIPFEPPSLVAHADIDAVWAPLYGKLSLFGESILHFDTFVTGGIGVFITESGAIRDPVTGVLPESTIDVNPAFNVGIGQRYFINEWLVFRVDIRNYSYIETARQSDLQNVMVLGLAISGFFPLTFAYEYQ
ncbi:MAG: outer membrane beta-barrel domain-containing protein [Myxococcota bacterium]